MPQKSCDLRQYHVIKYTCTNLDYMCMSINNLIVEKSIVLLLFSFYNTNPNTLLDPPNTKNGCKPCNNHGNNPIPSHSSSNHSHHGCYKRREN